MVGRCKRFLVVVCPSVVAAWVVCAVKLPLMKVMCCRWCAPMWSLTQLGSSLVLKLVEFFFLNRADVSWNFCLVLLLGNSVVIVWYLKLPGNNGVCLPRLYSWVLLPKGWARLGA